MARVRSQLDTWAPQVHEPGLGRVWWAQRCVFINQPEGTQATAAHATFIHDHIDRAIAALPAEIEAAGGMLIVHDWRGLSGYERDARSTFMARMRVRSPGYMRGAVAVLPAGVSPMFKMAVEAANMFAALALKRRVELATDLSEVLGAHHVGPSRPDDALPF